MRGIAFIIIFISYYIIMGLTLLILEFNKRRQTECYHATCNPNNNYCEACFEITDCLQQICCKSSQISD